MKRILLGITVVLLMVVVTIVVSGPTFANNACCTATQINGGGKTPQGEANGVPVVIKNHGGNTPGKYK